MSSEDLKHLLDWMAKDGSDYIIIIDYISDKSKGVK